MVMQTTETDTFVPEERENPILRKSEKRRYRLLCVSHVYHMNIHRVSGVDLYKERDKTGNQRNPHIRDKKREKKKKRENDEYPSDLSRRQSLHNSHCVLRGLASTDES